MMQKITRTLVEFLEPGFLFPEEHTQEVRSRDPLAVQPGPRVFAFSFYDVTYVEDNGERFVGKATNHSGRFYVGGRLVHRDELPDTDEFRILKANARCNGWEWLIECRHGNWQPFKDGDMLIPAENFA